MKNPFALKSVVAYVEAWQRTPQDKLTNLFEFFNSTTGRTERVVSYVLSGKELDFLIPSNIDRSTYNIKILMGVDPNADVNKTNDTPDFAPCLYPSYDAADKDYKNGKVMPVDFSTPPMLRKKTRIANRAKTIRNLLGEIPTLYEQIPQKAAYLFAVGWQRLDSNRLNTPFEGQSDKQQIRVKHYSYDVADSLDIYDFLAAKKGKNELDTVQINVYLGEGIAIYPEHPYTFRPVLGLFSTTAVGDVEAAVAAEEENSYYETANPCPPYCGLP